MDTCSDKAGALPVSETLVLSCVLAFASLVAILPVMCFTFFTCRIRFGETGEWQVLLPPGVERAHSLTAVTPICGAFAVACGLAALMGGIVFLAGRLRRLEGRRAARFAAWAGVFGLLLALIGVLHGVHVLVQEHPQAPLPLGQEKEVLKLLVLLAVGAVALFLGVLPGLATGMRRSPSRAGPWHLLAVAAVSTGVAIAAFRTLTFWQHFCGLTTGPQRPTDVSEGAILAAGGIAVALGALTLAAVTGRRRGSTLPGAEAGPESASAGKPLHVAATLLVVFVFLVGLRLLTRSSPEDPASRGYVPESFVATLSLAVEKCGGFAMVLGACISLLPLIAAWSWLSGGRSARPGRAAAWVGGVVAGVVLLAVAKGTTDIAGKIELLKSALTPRDLQGILLTNSVILLGVPVFLAARALAWTHSLTLTCVDTRVPSQWPDRIRSGSLAVLVTGAAATGVSFWYWFIDDPTPTLLRGGANVWIAGLAICAVLSIIVGIRDWLASVPTRRRRRSYRRRGGRDDGAGSDPSEKGEQVGGVVE